MRLDSFIIESSYIDPYEVVVDVYNRSLPYIMELIKSFHHINLQTPMLLSGRFDTKPLINKQIRTDRKPKDTSWNAHIILDDIFYNKFKVRVRSESVFVTGKYDFASSYGNSVYGIFPNGTNYKIIWSNSVQDLYSNVVDSGEYSYLGEDEEFIAQDLIRDTNDSIYNDAQETLTSDFEKSHSIDDYETEEKYEEDMGVFVDSHMDDIIYSLAKEEAVRIKEKNIDDITDLINHSYEEGDLKRAIMSHNEVMLSGKSYTGVLYSYLPYVLRYIEVNGTKKPTPHLFASAMVGVDFKKFRGDGISPRTINNRLSKEILSMIDMSDLMK
jgi:hypothetical protein